jgi:hypothetical protein
MDCQVNGPGSSLDAPLALALIIQEMYTLPDGAVQSLLSGPEDYVTIKYNSSGAEQWVARHNGTGND